MYLWYFPIILDFTLSIHWRMFGIFHLQSKLVKYWQNVLKSFGSLLSFQCSYFGHHSIIKYVIDWSIKKIVIFVLYCVYLIEIVIWEYGVLYQFVFILWERQSFQFILLNTLVLKDSSKTVSFLKWSALDFFSLRDSIIAL